MNSKTIFKLRSLFLSPNSKLELWLRTQYHRMNKTRFAFLINDWLARKSYQLWLTKQKKQAVIEDFDQKPGVTFLLFYPKDNSEGFRLTLKSLQKIHEENWTTVILTDQAGLDQQFLKEIIKDKRLKIHDPKSVQFPDEISGEFALICQAGDLLNENILRYFYLAFAEDDSADWYYYDCEYTPEDNSEITPLFKPQTLSPSTLLSQNYLTRGFIRTSFIKENWDSGDDDTNLLAEEYSLALKLCETSGNILHIPRVLTRQSRLVMPDTAQKQATIINYLKNTGLENVSAKSKPIGTWFTWKTHNPSVAIIIPTKNNPELLSTCLNGLKNKTNYKNYSIHIVDNNSDNPKTLDYYQELKSEADIKIHPYREKFNYSQANNLGAAKSDSDLLLFLNDDMEVFDPDWLDELVQWAVRPEVGVVGAKLIRSNRTIQHAGIVMGLNGFAGHIYLNAPEHYQGLFGSVDWYRDYLAVTGACQMIRRDVFEEANGFDEGYRIAFGDIDLCIRIHDLGYRIVYTPFASLFHYEGQSRGYETPQHDVLRAFENMNAVLKAEDPYFSPNLTYTRIPRCVLSDQTSEERQKTILLRKKFHEKG